MRGEKIQQINPHSTSPTGASLSSMELNCRKEEIMKDERRREEEERIA